MASIRNALLAALRSLMRGKSFLRALLAFWISPVVIKEGSDPNDCSPSAKRSRRFRREVEELLSESIKSEALRRFSQSLKLQFRERLWSNRACMLPSYNYQLPNGSEKGRYLAVDVGGSTLRVALVALTGLEHGGYEESTRIVRMNNFRIGADVKALVGKAFFDWMAARILETITASSDSGDGETKESVKDTPMPMGLAWSFPIEQTSLKGGLLQGMGKGFLAADGLLGQDLGDIIREACSGLGLNIEVAAIINDSSAALLSESYRSPSTRFGLILGTGFNIAAHLPVTTIDRPKYGSRPSSWFDRASHVIINTEMGMFGKGCLPLTRWDEQLKESHPKPDFQPLEHFVAGLYIGEIVRLIMVEAIETTGMLGGVVPPSMVNPYSLETETLSIMESDKSPSLDKAMEIFTSRHPSTCSYTRDDIETLCQISAMVARRSAAMVAAALVGLWELKVETEHEHLASLDDSPAAWHFSQETRGELELSRVTVGFNGSVIEQYPNYRDNCQSYIDELMRLSDAAAPSDSAPPPSIQLVPAKESSLLGAAVALACLERGKAN